MCLNNPRAPEMRRDYSERRAGARPARSRSADQMPTARFDYLGLAARGVYPERRRRAQRG